MVEFPSRSDLPSQQRPLVVMTYNIAGHDERFRSTHIAQIVAAINEVRPDIVGLQEVHRGTWQSRDRDQLEELEQGTGMHGFFGASFQRGHGQFGNAILTRGDIVSAMVHPLPGHGEPRSLIESVLRIDGATINFYVTHLAAWHRMNASVRGRQLDCVAKYIRTSTYPFLLAGDFNAAPDTREVMAFDRENLAQICGRILPVTNPLLHRRIDYVWADYGWEVNRTSVPHIGPSDHWPVVTELMWNRDLSFESSLDRISATSVPDRRSGGRVSMDLRLRGWSGRRPSVQHRAAVGSRS
jgi:endonuclease/exonuclease/phosphatase family metal-dependent hydrolase